MEWFVGHYLGGTGIDAGDASVSPIAAPSARMRNAATASVLVAGFDPLRDEGLAYATALSDAGVATQTKAFSGQIHGFFSYRMLIPEAEEAIDWVAQRLKDAFAQR